MDVYFFRHRFQPTTGRFGPVPGRCLFSVHGANLKRDGTAFAPEAATNDRVCVDGFEEDGPGSNVDPNVLAVELPWFLSFCRADAHVHDLGPGAAAAGSSSTLAALVRPGDIIIFGEPGWADAIAIDTVLCVGERPRLPVSAAAGQAPSFSLEADFDGYWRDCMSKNLVEHPLTWDAFICSPDFVLNLADSLGSDRAGQLLGHTRQTWHATAAVLAPMRIVGTRCRMAEPISATALADLFMSGNGFDFIPVGTPAASRHLRLATERPGVFIVTFERAKERLWPKGRGQPSIFRLADAEGRSLLNAIFAHADRLVHGPLRWIAPRRFSRFDDERRPVYVPVPEGRAV